MEKTSSQKIQLGIFVIIAMLVFLSVIYFVGNKQNMFGGTSNLKAVFADVNGLQLGNNVRYAGIDIGTVTEIEMINDTTICITLLIENDIMKYIQKNAVATISSDGLVGNMIVNITPGEGVAKKVENGDTIKTFSRMGTQAMLETLNETNKNAALLSANLVKISNEIVQGKGTMGLLIKDSLMAQDLRATMNYLKQTTQGTTESITNLNKLILDLNRKDNVIGTLNDTVVANRMKKIIVNLEKSSVEINKVITNVKEGKGAINYLSNDPRLVQQIDSTITNVNQATIKLNENLEALKHNFLFRGYFRKQEKEKAKKKAN